MERILHIAPLVAPLSEHAPGGAEQGLMSLALAQARSGAAVEVIAASGTRLPREIRHIDLNISPTLIIPAKTSPARQSCSLLSREDVLERERLAFAPVREFLTKHGHRYTVVHNHSFDYVPLFEFNSLGLPLVHTLHLPPSIEWIAEALRRAHPFPPHVRYVCVSQSAAALYHSAAGVSLPVVPYGVGIAEISFQSASEEHFLWVGRISREKGLHTAIKVACVDLGRQLVAVGRVYDLKYFSREIKPMLNHPLVTYLGHLTHREVMREMGKAKALLFPIEWEEPFGLVMVESLAAGTPVIAYRRGAVPEIVTHGVTGYVVDDETRFRQAILDSDGISRSACRESVASRYCIERFAADYGEIYASLSDAKR